MPRFFCTADQIGEEQILIQGEDAQHISRVLRMKPGEAVTVSDGMGMDYDCKICEFSSDTVTLEIEKASPNESEPTVGITLYQAIPKGDKLELIVQKAVELGAVKIVPVLTKRCVSRPDQKAMKKKIERYRKIVKEAAKQCGRGRIPEVGEMLTFSQAVEALSGMEQGILFYEKGGVPLREMVSPAAKEIGILIGSEGGFEEEEVLQAKEKGVEIATLGRLILRCETAPMAALSVLMNLTGNI